MTRAPQLVLAAGLMCAAGCSRDFSRPPPVVSISSFSPAHGFTGDPVAICGQHLDLRPELNSAYFDTSPAEVLPDGQPADAVLAPSFGCDHEVLWVRVPALPAEGYVPIKVSTTAGQGVSNTDFHYDGPGHPPAEVLAEALDVRSGLWGVFSVPETSFPLFGTISTEAGMLNLFERRHGLHLDFGLCHLPLSGAAALVTFLDFEIYLITLEFSEAGSTGFELRLWRWPVNLQDVLNNVFSAPEQVALPPTSDGQPFLPGMVWSFPLPRQGMLQTHDIVVTHQARPALAILSVQSPGDITVVELPDQQPYCHQGAELLGPILDLVYDLEQRDFYLALEGGNEIWRVSAVTHEAQRVWPPPDPTGHGQAIDCRWKNGPIAIRRSHTEHQYLRLYVSNQNGFLAREMKLADSPLGEHLTHTLKVEYLDAIPYAMTTGLYPTTTDAGVAVTGERLYVATQNGLRIIDISARRLLNPDNIDWIPEGQIAVPVNRGGPQGLAVNSQFGLSEQEADTILLTDANEEQVLVYRCGEEAVALEQIPIGSTFPHLATSYEPERLYLADALSNTVHTIDRNNGMRTGQFPIASLADHPHMGFGSPTVETLRLDQGDLLILPLTETYAPDDESRQQYRRLAFGIISESPPACGLTDSGLDIDDTIDQSFDELQLVAWDIQDDPEAPFLVLTRYFEQTPRDDNGDGEPEGWNVHPGRTWCLEVSPANAAGNDITHEPSSLCDLSAFGELGPGVLMVRAASGAPVIAQLEKNTDAERLDLGMRFLQEGPKLAQEGMVLALDPGLEDYITDLVILRRGTGEAPVYVAYLPLSGLGQVLTATFRPATGSTSLGTIWTGGEPTAAFASPDLRRLYVTHLFQGKVSVIQTDCEPIGECETERATVRVGAWPNQVVFDLGGRHAYVQHLLGNDISIIE